MARLRWRGVGGRGGKTRARRRGVAKGTSNLQFRTHFFFFFFFFLSRADLIFFYTVLRRAAMMFLFYFTILSRRPLLSTEGEANSFKRREQRTQLCARLKEEKQKGSYTYSLQLYTEVTCSDDEIVLNDIEIGH